MNKNPLRIVLASGIFYPTPGGPAIHVRRIAESLCAGGEKVTVVTYSAATEVDSFPFTVRRIMSGPKIIRWAHYVLVLIKEIVLADVVYAFDLTSAGLPAFILAKFFRKHFLIRVGGDPIWERTVEKNKRFISLSEYYEKKLQFVDGPFLFAVIKMILKASEAIVVYSPALRDFYVQYFGVEEARFFVVPNPYEPRERNEPEKQKHPVFIFAGRFVVYKNLHLVIDAFNDVWQKMKKGELHLIGGGPEETSLRLFAESLPAREQIIFMRVLPQESLFNEIRKASVALAPALTEYSPNFILESISLGKPALISRGHGLAINWPEWLTFDPYSKAELVRSMEMFYDDEYYNSAEKAVRLLEPVTTWDDVLGMHKKIINRITS